jgi:phosphopentomutase
MGLAKKRDFQKVLILVLDSVGIGEMEDAEQYGDKGANTLGNTARAVGGLRLPNLQALGLGNIAEIEGVQRVSKASGHYGKMREASVGKDTTTGHWEIAGLVVSKPFALFPNGFPPEIIEEFKRESGFDILGNIPASGTEIIERLGEEHERTGKLIVYTSADSVFQVAAHEEVVPLEELYRACEVARRILDKWRVARVIARPFVGKKGSYKRTYNRKDFSMKPDDNTLLDILSGAGVPVVGIGKIYDIFAGRGVTTSVHTEGNRDGLLQTERVLREMKRGLCFTNLVDFDMLYGHRRNPEGYARALEEVDAFLPRLMEALGDGVMFITADHGCDPTAQWSTDHTREYVPLLVWHKGIEAGKDLGVRSTFADVGQTIAHIFGTTPTRFGQAIDL